MKYACPACGRSTRVENDLGDFPTRCDRCNTLLRIPAAQDADAGELAPQAITPPAATTTRERIAPGTLAGMLTKERPAVKTSESPKRILRPESLREIARAHARQEALRKAQLRGNHQALGFLGTVGLLFVGLLALGALALQFTTMWHHH